VRVEDMIKQVSNWLPCLLGDRIQATMRISQETCCSQGSHQTQEKRRLLSVYTTETVTQQKRVLLSCAAYLSNLDPTLK
jgi:hypothetical protein